ncbi:Auxin-binding protein ABP19a [Bienertia sinuspersici]
MKILFSLLTISLLATLSNGITHDFCVADKSLPAGPTGYPCKDPTKLTVDDFIYTAFRGGAPLIPLFNSSGTFAYVKEFPALNGLGLSMIRLDLGMVELSLYIHIELRDSYGFIDTNYTAYYKKLEVGDVIIFPESLLHFQVNVGTTPAVAITTLRSANPGIQFVNLGLFASNLPVELVEKTVHLDHEQVIKLKKIFSGISISPPV